MKRLTRHLKEVDLTYSQHMRRALSISCRLALASASCFIHAFAPFIFETNASTTIKDLSRKI